MLPVGLNHRSNHRLIGKFTGRDRLKVCDVVEEDAVSQDDKELAIRKQSYMFLRHVL
jgi:hypothetical protein